MKAFFYDKDGMFYRVLQKGPETDDGGPLPKVTLLEDLEPGLFSTAPLPTHMQRSFELKRVIQDGLLGHRADYYEVDENPK